MRVEDAVAYPEGALTLREASLTLREGERALVEGAAVFDLAGVTQVDSSALSLILSWRRQAGARQQALTFRNVPDSLHSLARLYGLADLID
ncbi:MAG: STAS domain-containing protein [Gallionellaceae bacterium]|nr:STAS domain-containing protein [Gallionellaceae bacterium]